MNSKNKKIMLFLAFAAVLVVAGVGGTLLSRNDSKAVSDKKSNDDMSMFAFTGAEGWRKGPSNKTSMALFNSASPSAESPCFTSTEYYEGTVDAAAQLQKNRRTLTEGGYTVTSMGTKTLVIRTAHGDKQYDLHLSNITTPGGATKVMGGNALGYLQLPDGYLKIYGNCNTAEQLPRTFPALEAVTVAGA